jgi:hypothetical protein
MGMRVRVIVVVVTVVVVLGPDPRDDLDPAVLHAAHRQDPVRQVGERV